MTTNDWNDWDKKVKERPELRYCKSCLNKRSWNVYHPDDLINWSVYQIPQQVECRTCHNLCIEPIPAVELGL